MSRMHWMPRMAALMTVLAVAACSDSTGPDENQPFDPEVVVENYAAVNVVLDSEPFQNFQNINVVFGGTTSAPTELFNLIRGDGSTGRVMAAHAGIISEENRGKTFAYDAVEMDYVWDESRTDAPATGVRFIMYSEGTDGRPDATDERGYADLIDLGDNSQSDIELRLEGYWDSTQFMEYHLELNEDDITGATSLGVDGFLSDGTEQLTFEVDVGSVFDEVAQTTTTTLDYDLAIAARGFVVTTSLTLVVDELENETATVDMTVQHGTDVLRLQATGDDVMIDGTISIGGQVFALVSGDPENPSITKADGTSLTTNEIQALTGMIDFVDELFSFLGELLTPVTALIFLGFVL